MPIETIRTKQARANLKGNRTSIWPDGRRVQTRLGDRTTCTSVASFKIDKNDMIFTSGSCFARNIEKKLASLGFNLPMMAIETPREERVSETHNEILNKYTTAATLNELRWALGIEPFPAEAYLEVGEGLVHDPYLHPNIPPVSRERAEARRADIHRLVQVLPQCRLFIMTLGLVEAWYDRTTGKMLNGTPPQACLSADPDRFLFQRQSHADIVEELEQIHMILRSHGHPDFKFLVTVSPVPFKATYSGQDAIAANCYSKSALRSAAEEFAARHANVDYFPSYEMVTLSDRRQTYTVDNIHIQEPAVSRIMDRAVATYVEGMETSAEDALAAYGTKPREIVRSAILLRKQNDYDTAARLLDLVANAELEGQSGLSEKDFSMLYGTTLARAGRNAEAEPHLYRAVAIDPADARANYKLGLITARLRRLHATIFFERACELAPAEPDYWWRLGVEYARYKDSEKAVVCLQRALSIAPGHAAAKEALGALTDVAA